MKPTTNDLRIQMVKTQAQLIKLAGMLRQDYSEKADEAHGAAVVLSDWMRNIGREDK